MLSTMNALDLLNHTLNFAAPAVAVGLVLALCGRWLFSKNARRRALWVQVAVNAGVGVLALLLGLWVFGRDGKMATYCALLLCCASSQWWLLRR